MAQCRDELRPRRMAELDVRRATVKDMVPLGIEGEIHLEERKAEHVGEAPCSLGRRIREFGQNAFADDEMRRKRRCFHLYRTVRVVRHDARCDGQSADCAVVKALQLIQRMSA